MAKAEDFSVVIIVKNGEKTLPRLLNSLKGVDDIVLMDTGSTDKTIEIAKSFKCNVIDVGDKFNIEVTEVEVKRWELLFNYKPSFKAGKRYFNFSKARNCAASFAKNDWVFQPDADEEMIWDLTKVREIIQMEDHLVYKFCYQHNEDGSCALELQQSKFYRKSKLRWEKWVHEVLQKIPGQNPKDPKWCDDIYHHHWQEGKQERGSQYLAGLELSVLDDPKDNRNVYYLAREYHYNGKHDLAIKWFDKAIKLGRWLPERNQAYVYQGLSYRGKGKPNEAIECFHKAMITFDERREPFWELGLLYEEQKMFDRALVYYSAALAIPFKPQGYLNNMDLYGWKIPDKIAYIYNIFKNKEKSKEYWLEALKYNPPRAILNNGIRWFYDNLPLITIVIPTVRIKGYDRLMRSIIANTVYPRYDIIKKGGLKGTAITKFNEGVKEAKGEFIVYIADDCEVGLGWLTQAYSHFKENFRDKGLVIFNDDYWEDRMAHHFLCSKNIKDELDGFIWYPGYNHLGADNELYGRLKNKDLVEYCQFAKIKHHHYSAQSRGLAKAKIDIVSEKIEECRAADEKLLAERAKRFGFKRIYLKEGETEIK